MFHFTAFQTFCILNHVRGLLCALYKTQNTATFSNNFYMYADYISMKKFKDSNKSKGMAPICRNWASPIPKWEEGGGGWYVEMVRPQLSLNSRYLHLLLPLPGILPRGLGISPAGFAA